MVSFGQAFLKQSSRFGHLVCVGFFICRGELKNSAPPPWRPKTLLVLCLFVSIFFYLFLNPTRPYAKKTPDLQGVPEEQNAEVRSKSVRKRKSHWNDELLLPCDLPSEKNTTSVFLPNISVFFPRKKTSSFLHYYPKSIQLGWHRFLLNVFSSLRSNGSWLLVQVHHHWG